jgi:hypothetical protein
VLDVRLDFSIGEFTTNKTLSVENAAKNKMSGKMKGMTQTVTDVLWGFMATWFFAASPINLSVSEKAT